MSPLVAGPRFGSATLLLLSADEANRLAISASLRRHGYRVLEARHEGEALLNCLRHDGIDLLVADGDGMDERQSRFIDELPHVMPNVPVLFVGQPPLGADRAATLALPRPFTPTSLVFAVRDALSRSRR